ncbi:Uncharacterised protein [Legionella busanensis]|uniref:Uncharacterized protein n=1 Tax=Legionella busanensis TaxID=190655 RepID=A0A378JMF4_9GAMM|nr:hypothetical protein [Legionella busanensis]STX52415.1 Uncharacterised protein [Legionella busanensis]
MLVQAIILGMIDKMKRMIFFNKISKPTHKVERSLNLFKKDIDNRYEKLAAVYSYLDTLKEKQKYLLQERKKKNDKQIDKELEYINNDINYLNNKLLEEKPEERLKEMRLKYKNLKAQFDALKEEKI